MKTPHPSTLERTETGAYAGSIGGQGLSPEQMKTIRKVLAQSPTSLHLGTVAAKAGIALNSPTSQQAMSQFLIYLESTGEAQRCLEGESRKTGRGIFRGYVGTDHLRSLMEKGLA